MIIAFFEGMVFLRTLLDFYNWANGKKIDVIGIGVSNLPLIKKLAEVGAKVTAHDRRESILEEKELLDLGVKLVLGENYLSDIEGEMVFKTPGLRFDVPELLEAKERGAKITSEMELFFEVCPAHIFAVTGSDGKTTTTTLIYKMLKEQGKNVYVGGNIGNPLLCEADKMTEDDFVVLELSSFQLHTMTKSPERALITNISPNHLDMHKSYEEYIDAKCNIYKFQKSGDLLVLNADNEVTGKIAEENTSKTFSRQKTADVYLKENVIYKENEEILNTNDIKVPGIHNVENFMAAILMVGDIVDKSRIRRVAREFGGVEHRIELVRELDGVKFYNSSIDSSPNRTVNTLNVFKKPVILIAGGKDKGIPYDELGPSLETKVKALILIGATSDKIEAVLKKTGKDIPVIKPESYEEAVKKAKEIAKEGDVVLLSPASTSFDRFKNFEERGRLFKTLVNEL